MHYVVSEAFLYRYASFHMIQMLMMRNNISSYILAFLPVNVNTRY